MSLSLIHDYKQYLWNIFHGIFFKNCIQLVFHIILYARHYASFFKTIQKVGQYYYSILKIRKLRLTEVK